MTLQARTGTHPKSTAADAKPSAYDKALELLHKGVADLMSSQGWVEALRFKAKFYQYSFFNTSLILAQFPHATLVAGYRKWQEIGRQVKKGEKGIAIMAPILARPKPEENSHDIRLTDEGPRVLVGFRSVYVFDVSQTEGEPLPEPPLPVLLTSNHRLIQPAISVLKVFAMAEGLTVSYDLEHPRAYGMYRPAKKQIALKAGLPPLQTLKTLIHELAHALLHDLESSRTTAELEAESCAFLVCHQIGLDTSSYSFAYLANWSESLEQLIAAGERAGVAARKIASALKGLEGLTLTEPGLQVLP